MSLSPPRPPSSGAPRFPGTRVCVLCGTTDEHGLQDHMALEHGILRLHLTPGSRFQGFAGIMHGGFVALFLDEVVGVAVGFGNGGVSMTHALQLEYLRPVPLFHPLIFEGWMGEHLGGHLFRGYGRVLDARGEPLVRTTADFAVMQQPVMERLLRRWQAAQGSVSHPPETPDATLAHAHAQAQSPGAQIPASAEIVHPQRGGSGDE